MPKPTIVFVPGLWEGPAVFNTVSSLLQRQGFTTYTVTNPSTGTTSPGNPSFSDDVRAAQAVIGPLVLKEEQEIVMVLHSADGAIGSPAAEGLTVGKRRAEGKKGGVVHLPFITAGIVPVGTTLQKVPFMDINIKEGRNDCVNPRVMLFSDFSDEEAAELIRNLRPQPAEGYIEVVEYAAWVEVPSTYLICISDQILPHDFQQAIAGIAGSEIVTLDCGHVPMLNRPKELVELTLKTLGNQVPAFT